LEVALKVEEQEFKECTFRPKTNEK